MKDKLNKKTILIIIGILLLIAVAILLFSLFGNKDKFKNDYEKVEKNIKDTLINFKAGYITDYSGTELLFDKKSINIKDIDDASKFSYVFMNMLQNEEQPEISDEAYEKIADKIKDLEDYIVISGNTIKNKMKELLDVDWKHKSITNIKDYIYNIEYLENADVYLITPSADYDKYEEILENNYKTCEIEIIESTSTNKGVKTTIAVAYVVYPENGEEKIIKYYSDKEQKNLVFEVNTDDLYILDENNELVKNENVDTIKKHIDKFKKYTVTSTKENDKFFITNIKQK